MPTPAAQAITHHKLMAAAANNEGIPFGMINVAIRKREAKARPWDPKLASWIPFGKSLPLHETGLFEKMRPLTFDAWCENLAAAGRRPGPTDYHRLTILHPTSCETPPASQSIYKVFGNHGALLVRASPVVHMSYMGSALLHGALASTTTNMFHGDVCVLAAADAPLNWEICASVQRVLCQRRRLDRRSARMRCISAPQAVRESIWGVRDCVSVLGAPGHRLRPTRKLGGELERRAGAVIKRADGPCQRVRTLDAAALSWAAPSIFFFRRWDSITQMEKTVAPSEPLGRDTTNDLSSTVLAGYARWLEIKPTTDEGDWLDDFDSVVRTVSMYLERWQDLDLWSRICGIVVEVPWKGNLEALAEMKANAWHYLTTSDRSNPGRGEAKGSSLWEVRLRELFDDLVGRLCVSPGMGSSSARYAAAKPMWLRQRSRR